MNVKTVKTAVFSTALATAILIVGGSKGFAQSGQGIDRDDIYLRNDLRTRDDRNDRDDLRTRDDRNVLRPRVEERNGGNDTLPFVRDRERIDRDDRNRYDQYSVSQRREAQRGYKDGLISGKRDALTHFTYFPGGSSRFQLGNQDYRRGFEDGYNRAYRGANAALDSRAGRGYSRNGY